MPIGSSSLSLLTFPQFWDGNSLTVRFLCLPKGDPTASPKGVLPAFAASKLVFQAKLIAGLDRLPHAPDATTVGPLLLDPPPTQKAELFQELTNHFNIQPRVPLRPQVQFRKAVTDSYRALVGDRQLSPLLAEAAEFDCALHQGAVDQPLEPAAPPSDISWGRLLAFALRQPNLASGLGLIGQTTVTPADPAFFASGGWLFIDLDPSSDYAAEAGFTALYAARIPKLSAARPVFAAVLFPVSSGPQDVVADDLASEAELYSDGIAKLVHCAQGDGSGDSIQLAWEDEQIAEWFQRQVTLTPQRELDRDAPNGVAGYRVDVRKAGQAQWNSLTRIESLGDLQLGPFSLGSFQGESLVEVAPAQLSPTLNATYWFPSYFSTWRGSSLALTDADLKSLHSRADVQATTSPQNLLNRDQTFVPVDDKAVPLQYGETYEFRVRLADLTRGGPEVSAPLPNPARNSIASLQFHRRKPPGPIEILERPALGSRQVRIARPRLGHPEALFTGKATFENLEDDLATMKANPKITREISVADPDVLSVEILVEVKALAGDAAPFFELYRTTRVFDADELTIDLDFQDHATLTTLDVNQPAEGSLALPAARDLRLTFVAIGTDQADYFEDETSRRGAPVTLDLHAGATAEADLLADPEVFPPLRSFFFQPPPPDNSVAAPAERLAAEIGLDYAALTLSGRQGRRTVVACSAEIHHTLSPDLSAITFASNADLVQRWINVVQFQIQRDWTWDGLDEAGIKVTRTVHFAVGADSVETSAVIRLPRVTGKKSAIGLTTDARDPIRQFTDLVFFDAFDPQPKSPGELPSEITIDYVFESAFQGLPGVEAIARTVLLPVTTPPSQTPRIVSAGIALSEYQFASDYSSTSPRQRMLWFEFAEKLADPQDAYFARVLANSPDPLLLPDEVTIPEVLDPPLPIDPEWMRLITPGQPRDDNGLRAMQQLQGPPEETHFLIPLPPNLQETSPELFGFFTYEVRLGHTSSRWSTAQGRFGPSLRIAGVQHPAPPLVCHAARNSTAILVQAAFSNPVLDGANLRPPLPQTLMWALLYARVRQADGAAWRNVLLARTELFVPLEGNNPKVPGVPVVYGEGAFDLGEIIKSLGGMGLPADEPLTVLASELLADPDELDPLGDRLGYARMLRISPLVSVPDAC
jgi:hypothetical protein